MIGIVICCHGNMGAGMRNAAEMIVGPKDQIEVVSVEPGSAGQDILDALRAAIKNVDTGEGVLLLTDLFGGTPTNVGCALLGEAPVEVVTGFNLPLLIKAITSREETQSLPQLAKTAAEYGQRHISVAGDLLRSAKEKKDS